MALFTNTYPGLALVQKGTHFTVLLIMPRRYNRDLGGNYCNNSKDSGSMYLSMYPLDLKRACVASLSNMPTF